MEEETRERATRKSPLRDRVEGIDRWLENKDGISEKWEVEGVSRSFMKRYN